MRKDIKQCIIIAIIIGVIIFVAVQVIWKKPYVESIKETKEEDDLDLEKHAPSETLFGEYLVSCSERT